MSWQELLQFAVVIGPVVGVVATGIWWCVQRHLRALWARINKLQKQIEVLTDEKENLQRQCRMATTTCADRDRSIAGLRARQTKAQKKKQFLRLRVADLRKQIGTLRITSLGPDVKALLENRVAELGQDLQEARAENEMLLTRSREAEALAGKRQTQLSALTNEKIQLEESTQKRAASAEKLHEVLKELEEKVDGLNNQIENLTTQNQQFKEELGQKKSRVKEAEEQIFDLKMLIADLQTQIEGTVEQKGRIWERPFSGGAVPFEPLAARPMPILSILNLKGGVGKTTIAANLGAMLGMQGSRVLLIDLDYQRSLTLLCCSSNQVEQLHRSRRSLQHFLLDPLADAKSLLACATPVPAAEGCEIVINSDPLDGSAKGDNLEDAEMHLLADWLTNPTGPDIRLILRSALHSPLIRERFDYVLLDCPPRLSTACINALAASDFALVPVMLDYTSAISVPNLLRKLGGLRDKGVLAELGVLGVLANRVSFRLDRPVNAQAVVWDELQAPCKLAWGKSVGFFRTMIKQSPSVAEAAARHHGGKATRTLAVQGDDLKPIFHDLVQELKERIAHESQRLAAVPSKPDTPSGVDRGVHANDRRP